MLSSLDLAAVNLFLITARKEIDKNNAYFVYYRNVKSGNKVVNARQASLDIGIIKISEILNHIKELQPSDYFRISRDREFSRNFNAEIYEFKKIINRKFPGFLPKKILLSFREVKLFYTLLDSLPQ